MTFTCTATGHPNVHILSWQTATGLNFSYFPHTTRNVTDYKVSVTSTFTINDENVCWEVGGFNCTISSGSSHFDTKNVHFPCLPGNYNLKLAKKSPLVKE